jgi:hypothetical protein
MQCDVRGLDIGNLSYASIEMLASCALGHQLQRANPYKILMGKPVTYVRPSVHLHYDFTMTFAPPFA